MQLPVGTIVGEYQITGLLGEGGMGVVYSGVHPVIGKEVAIKVLSPNLAPSADIVGRFVQEARAVNQIGHPNIIDIFAFGESDELGHYFVMPKLNGEDLRQRVERVGPLPLQEAIAVTEQICDALEAAHEKGIYHRDLKPDNVFLVPRRRGGDMVKVLDFGIAKLSEGGSMTVTRTGAPMGTPLFMSPEQWEAVNIDHRTDIYALGILFQFMITGRFPFESDSQVALMRMHCDQHPNLPSAFGGPAAMDRPVAKALAKSADDRFPSSGQFIIAIKRAMTGTDLTIPASPRVKGTAAPSVLSQQPATETRSKSPLAWIIGGVAALAAVVVAVIVLGGNGDANEGETGEQKPSQLASTTPLAADAATPVTPADAAAVVTPPEPPKAEKIVVSINSKPRGAKVVDSTGSVLGTTPATIKLELNDTPMLVTLVRRGYEDEPVEVQRNGDKNPLFKLTKRGQRPAGKPTTKPTTTTTKPDTTTTKPDTTTKTPGTTDGSGGKDKWGETTNPFNQ